MCLIKAYKVLLNNMNVLCEHSQNLHRHVISFQASNESCTKPEVQIFFLSSVKICGPGIYCLLNFFLLFFNKDTRAVWREWFNFFFNKLLCKRTEKDGKSSSGSESLPKSNETRPRSVTLDTNASLNSLHKLVINSTKNTLQSAVFLQTIPSNENNSSNAGSITPEEDSSFKINGNTSWQAENTSL